MNKNIIIVPGGISNVSTKSRKKKRTKKQPKTISNLPNIVPQLKLVARIIDINIDENEEPVFNESAMPSSPADIGKNLEVEA